MSQHEFQVGDSVLVDMSGALVPGVIEEHRGDQCVVRLAQAWSDASGQRSDSVTVPTASLQPGEDAGPAGTLPAP
jgi:hypothetical protein